MNDRISGSHRKIVPLDLGLLPIEKVNRALGLNLAAAIVHFSVRAQAHAEKRHPAAFSICLRNIRRIVAAPDYIGKAPDQTDGFELIGEAPRDHAIVLVAIKMRQDKAGRYAVVSTYVIDRNKLERRVRKGFLKRA